MIDGLQTGYQNLFSLLDVTEGNGTFFEIAVVDLGINYLVHQLTNGFVIDFFQTAGGSLYRVGHHKNSFFTGTRIGAGLREKAFVDVVVRMVIAVFDVEIASLAGAMVGGDESLDDFR